MHLKDKGTERGSKLPRTDGVFVGNKSRLFDMPKWGKNFQKPPYVFLFFSLQAVKVAGDPEQIFTTSLPF